RTLTEDVDADTTVITMPANIAATLLSSTSPAAADLLAGIEHASVALLTLLYERSEVPVPLDASGVLIPRSEGAATTAISWGSSKWAHWNDGRHVILRASIGHDGDERGRVWSDEQLVDAVRADLRLVMGITAPPAAVRTSRWLDGFPQYRPGHSSLVQRIHDHLAVDAPTVALAGMAYDGVGIPASIGTGRRAAAHLSDRLSDRN
ncbi:MAG: protoporphyrinogen oxidase, partial [Actinomycetes bacterium]